MVIAIEQAIVSRLATALAPLPVDALPARGYQFSHARGAAVVLASRLAAGPSRDTAVSVQEAELTVEVALYGRSLREGGGVWTLFDAARRSLLSWRPEPGATPLRLADARITEMDDGVWLLATAWQTRIPLVPDLDAGSEPLLTRVTYEEI